MEPETLRGGEDKKNMLNKTWPWSSGMWVSLSTDTPEGKIYGDVRRGIHSIIQRLGRIIPVFSSQNQTLERQEMELALSFSLKGKKRGRNGIFLATLWRKWHVILNVSSFSFEINVLQDGKGGGESINFEERWGDSNAINWMNDETCVEQNEIVSLFFSTTAKERCQFELAETLGVVSFPSHSRSKC